MKFDDLIKFGLTKTEAKIYLELVKLNETKIGELIKKTGLHRGTVYNSLNDLIKKGFVKFIDEDGKRYYKISGKKIFLNVLENKTKEIKSNKEKIEDLFKNIEKLREDSTNQNVSVFHGLESFKVNFLDIYKECKSKNIEYLFMGEGGEMSKATGIGYYKHTQKIKCRVLLSEETKPLSYHKYTQGNIRYMSTKVHSPVNFWIYANKVLFVIWQSNPLVTIKIESKQLADGFRNYFEDLWEMFKTNRRKLESRHILNFYEFIQQAENSLDILGICGIEPLHEGRGRILELLKNNKKVRVLLANPKSKEFEKRVKLEEQFIKSLKESRILFELKSSIANLKDIKARSKNKGILEVRLYDKKPNFTIINLDKKKVLYNRYGTKKGEYGASKKTLILEKGFDKNFKIPEKVFEEYWKSAKPLKI